MFGSNLAGRHGKGSALEAIKKYGAVYGKGTGLQGRSYAIPTKDEKLRSRSLEEISHSVRDFVAFARSNPQYVFYVTRIGCGLAGYKDEQIAPMFIDTPDNCVLPEGWRNG